MKKIGVIILLILLLMSCDQKEKESIDTGKENKIILSLGDSLTAGFSLPIEESYPFQLQNVLTFNGYSYEVINAGVSGDTSKNLLERVDIYLQENENIPDIAILAIGANDGMRGQSIDDLKNNIISIIDKLQEKNIKVILCGMKIPPNFGLLYTNNFSKIYKEIAKEKNTYFYEFFLEGVVANKMLNLDDGIHPNKEGYTVISKNMYDFLINNNLINHD